MNKKLTIRERIYKWLFLASDGYKSSVKWLSGICRFCFSVTLFSFLIAFIFYFGFSGSAENLAGLRLTEINDEYAIAEILVPIKYIGHSLETVNINNRFGLKLVAVKIAPKEGILTSIFRRNYKVDLLYDPHLPLHERDILILAGKIYDIKRFIES